MVSANAYAGYNSALLLLSLRRSRVRTRLLSAACWRRLGLRWLDCCRISRQT